MINGILRKSFITVLCIDILLLAGAWYSAYLLRFNFQIPPDSQRLLLRLLPLIITIKIICFYFFDVYQGMWRYTSVGDLFNIIKACIVGSLLIFLFALFSHGLSSFSRSVFIIDGFLTLILIGGYRFSIRIYFWFVSNDESARINISRFSPFGNGKEKTGKKLLIAGAGDGGEKIYREIRDNYRLNYSVVGFVDDDQTKIGRKIHGVPILGSLAELGVITKSQKIEEILIAIPSATSDQMRGIVECCKECNIDFKTLPGMGELINGKVSVKAIRDVAYRDLLGREVIRLEEERIGGYLSAKNILITGAGGSIGSELCRQVGRFSPAKIILYDTAESPLYDIELELKKNFPYIEIVPLLADICNPHQLSRGFDLHRPHVVFHAAAYKHVPMLEMQPWEAVDNNILGSRNVIEACIAHSVDRVIFVSTDKAVRPSNIMGASKRTVELQVQGQNGCGITDIPFITVRFGNVVGSVGSVVPLFRRQIEAGGPVTVTHPDVTRYFMTIPEACQLILQAGVMGEGGEIFILDMGTPIKIVDMARDLIRLSGFVPDEDIKIEYTGLRPGEKLFEELITEGEGIVPTPHEKIVVLRGQVCDQVMLNGDIDALARLAHNQDAEGIKAKLRDIVPEYSPWGENTR